MGDRVIDRQMAQPAGDQWAPAAEFLVEAERVGPQRGSAISLACGSPRRAEAQATERTTPCSASQPVAA